MGQRTMKTRLSAEERRQSIIAAASPLFAEFGFRGVTTKRIADGAGVSEALLYRYFPSKESLFKHVQDQLCRHPEAVTKMLTGMEPGTQSLVSFVFLHVKSMLIEQDRGQTEILSKLMLRSIMDDGVFAKLFIDRLIVPWRNFFQKHLQAADQAGHLVQLRADDLAFWFCHHLTVQVHLIRMSPEQLVDYPDIETLANNMTTFMLRGIGMKEEAIAEFFRPEALHAMEVWRHESH